MGKSSKTKIGYRYKTGLHFILGLGVVDGLRSFSYGGRDVFAGWISEGRFSVNRPQLFGGEKSEGGFVGNIFFKNGRWDQPASTYLSDKIDVGEDGRIPAFRGRAAAIFEQTEVGNNPYPKDIYFVPQRIFKDSKGDAQWQPTLAAINRDVTIKLSDADDLNGSGDIAADTAAAGIQAAIDTNAGVVIDGAGGQSLLTVTPKIGTYTATNYWGIVDLPENGWRWSCVVIVDDDPTKWINIGPPNITFHATPQEAFDEVVAAGPSFTIPLQGSKFRLYIGDSQPLDNIGGVSFDYKVEAATQLFDMNVVHAIREAMTDPLWGKNIPAADFDTTWDAAALKVFNEKIGVSLVHSTDKSVDDYISALLSYIDAKVYENPFTGKWSIKLIRNDYSVGALPIITDEDIIEWVPGFGRANLNNPKNSLTLIYADGYGEKPSSITVNDPVSLAEIGRLKPFDPMKFPWLHRSDVARDIAFREFNSLTLPVLAGEIKIKARQDLSLFLPGEPVLLQSARYGISEVVRVLSYNKKNSGTSAIGLSVSGDIYGHDSVLLTITDPVVPTPQTTSQVQHKLVEEAPYWVVTQVFGDTDAANRIGDGTPGLGYLLVNGVQPDPNTLYGTIYVDEGQTGAFTAEADLHFVPAVSLTADVTGLPSDTVFSITSLDEALVLVGGGELCYLNGELISIETIDLVGGTMTVKRGLLDTLPTAHLAGSPVLYFEGLQSEVSSEFLDGVTVDVKLQSANRFGTSDLASAAIDTIVFSNRAARPLPVGNFALNGNEYNTPLLTLGASNPDVVLTWASRNRLTQTAGMFDAYSAGNITPEAGMTSVVQIAWLDATLVQIGALVVDLDVGAALTYTFTGYTPPAEARYASFTVRSLRDGLNELNTPEFILPISRGYGNGYGITYGG